MRGDMKDLPFGPDTFDLIWSEGAAYIMGISEAFSAWREFLRPGGYVVVSEATWLVPDPPAEVREFWAAEYPGMTDVAGNLARIEAAGYEVVGHFTLPDDPGGPTTRPRWRHGSRDSRRSTPMTRLRLRSSMAR